ncbi:adenylate/guanylate cyclase domain-containing protein [Spirulina subsalsa FACHB-351]|uniref:Adenylate/guanylate cyclase domain-containing protein n=1 Tax=Spirulina subsalsa FACHB-351 TaxID=234711 RepID=A0ABT3L7J1_9CYAN|nr:adenylate/guanylate cyclase domain-containing protein [Spirulina subsalsa]MCW6037481.1 adenylate/guanylate cyclase domain-containing protein [Spirulina subsalsa FACHB-351]
MWFHSFRLCQARLSRSIAFWVFLSLVIIEAIILIPSYRKEEQRQLNNLENISQATVTLIAALSEMDMSTEELQEKVRSLIADSSITLGMAIYDQNHQTIEIIGESPQLTPQDISGNSIIRRRSADRNRYDIAWSPESLNINYILIARLDASRVQRELNFFILRIVGLVVIIAIVVTLTTMIIVGVTVITPILQLRDDLVVAGETLSRNGDQNKNSVYFYALTAQRKDELGVVMQAFNQMFKRVSQEIEQRKQAQELIRLEQEKSEQLLLNILPQSIATLLKQGNKIIAKEFEEVTILFADIVGFTQLSSQIPPEELVELLNRIFSCFDNLTEFYNLEKIKTIGDSYMVVGGLPTPRQDHAEAIAEMALAMQKSLNKIDCSYGPLEMRMGINTGNVVAGVIGKKKFIYDLWGDAVNVASRMESHGVVGKIQVTEATYQRLEGQYHFEPRGKVEIKGKGEMETYFLLGRKGSLG